MFFATAGFLAALVLLVDCAPRAFLISFFETPFFLLALLDMFRLTLLLVGVTGFVTAGHGSLLGDMQVFKRGNNRFHLNDPGFAPA